jgi:uncharacterized protein (DUF697 family)
MTSYYEANAYGPAGEIWGEGEAFGEMGVYGEEEYYGEGELYGQGELYGEGELYGQGELSGETYGYGAEVQLNEVEEMQFASELLAVQSEEELDQFLGKLFGRVARGAGAFLRSPVGRALGGVLKNAARRALPVVGGALGSFVLPGVGSAIGSQLGGALASSFEAEAGLDPAQQEFEAARRYVQVAATAAQRAAAAAPGTPPMAVAQQAVNAAMRRHLGGVANGARPRRQTGRWIRRGRAIIVLGA